MAGFVFLSPWALFGLLALPVLWYVLKITPPKPRHVRFPGIRILQELQTTESSATQAPWWLLLLRLALVTMLIFALSRPVFHQNALVSALEGPLVLVIDNDWSMADGWRDHLNSAHRLVEVADEAALEILIVATASPIEEQALKPLSGAEALATLDSLTAHPWPTNRKAHLKRLQALPPDFLEEAQIYWISNGLKEIEPDGFVDGLADIAPYRVVSKKSASKAALIRKVVRHPEGFEATVDALHSSAPPANLLMQDEDRTILYEAPLKKGGAPDVYVVSVPQELKARTQRVALEGVRSVGGHYLLDQRWRDQRVGILSSAGERTTLLDASYFLEKSLLPHAQVDRDALSALLQRPLSVLFDPREGIVLTQSDAERLSDWVAKGGLYVRFADPEGDVRTREDLSLLPLDPMDMARTFGGSLSWDSQIPIAPFPDDGPFRGLEAPRDVSLKKQVLARPGSLEEAEIWAMLEDQTPLVSARQKGEGWFVYIHVSATPDWSDLPYSGTFELMMQRLLLLAINRLPDSLNEQLDPLQVMNGFAVLSAPQPDVEPLMRETVFEQKISPRHPPGYYGSEATPFAFNAGAHLGPLSAIDRYAPGTPVVGLGESRELRFAPWLFLVALCLFVIDWLVSLRLKGVLGLSRTAAACVLVLLPLTANGDDAPISERDIAAASAMRMAYLVTGNDTQDRTSQLGLDTLSKILYRRTSVEMAPSMAFDPEIDDPSLFPLIYWPLKDQQTTLGDAARKRLKNFMETGGFILFDTMGKDQPDSLSELNDQLSLPRLEQVPENHVLTRSFYLLQDFPGRFNGQRPWIAADTSADNDRVSSLMVGSNSWAEAWAYDEKNRPLYGVVPGGERQREQAFRFGVNLVMYVLSGNYKGDQVHIPTIIQRLGL